MPAHRWRLAATLLPLLALLAALFPLAVPARADHTPQPTTVGIPGSYQFEAGCPGDWQPDCPATKLVLPPGGRDTIWRGAFNVPPGSYAYKAALNNAWDENYGRNAQQNGADIPLEVADDGQSTRFYYSHESHWITSSRNSIIAAVPGSFQQEIGCPGDWQPDCLRSWLQDTDGDGIYTFVTRAIPEGNYEGKVALDENWNVNYGANGQLNGANIAFSVPPGGKDVVFSWDSTSKILTVSVEGAPRGNLALARAYWVQADTIAWPIANPADLSFALHASPTGELTLDENGVGGGTSIPLSYDPAGLPDAVLAKFPHLAGHAALRLAPADFASVPAILRGQFAVAARDDLGPVDATSLQIPGVLDDLYTYSGALGISWKNKIPTLRVWAPTAQSVRLQLFDSASDRTAQLLPMTRDNASGVWSIKGTPDWKHKYYLYEVQVFVRATGNVETNLVTDPYSVSLATNSARSQIINLDADGLKPPSWDALAKPKLSGFEQISLYELHIRDFSVFDQSIPTAERGTYLAFTRPNGSGMQQLRRLARAGLTHVHLLPAFDIASVNEDKAAWQSPDPAALAALPPDSDQQAEAVEATANQDGFNWGYDPWHFNAPEGSYSTNPNGPTRIREFRQMVRGLNRSGLRVVMDVVYNHTSASGQSDRSVFDRIVPGYYHRLNDAGNVEKSTCCENTATEHAMMEKFMIDSVLIWATAYKVDGFRFDLMGHHLKANMVKLRAALDELTLAKDGVDGKQIYLYGEGWNFGEVANNARGVNATQLNMPGTGIATFSDRLRDGVRGGGPFSGLQEQGFINGLLVDPNATDQGSPNDQRERLLRYTDWIKVGLAGNLAAYQLTDRFGNQVTGAGVDYNGSPAGYTLDPQEVITYVEAHDNETLFDAIQVKAPVGTSLADRVRMQNLGNSIVLLGQGVPFLHAGQEILRSKSGDRNSYNSGDWFNWLDYTFSSNNWGVGLPPAESRDRWGVLQPLLANPALTPAPANILSARAHVEELLKIRTGSQLFQLPTAAEVQARLSFANNGPDQLPGLIIMRISDEVGADLDPRAEQIVVVFNATTSAQSYQLADTVGKSFGLHPTQLASADPLVRTASFNSANGTFSVPARTTAVFVLP